MKNGKIFGKNLIRAFIYEGIPYGFVWDEKIEGDYIKVVSFGDYEVGGQNPLQIEIPGLSSWKEKGVCINPHKIYEEVIDFFVD